MPNEFKYGDITYNNITPINRHEMDGLSIKPEAWLEMAATAQLIPVTTMELRYLCTQMPIVFSPMGDPMPIAITSFKNGNNAFVHDKKWQENTYIPAAIKRYPFVLSNSEGGKSILYIDDTALTKEGPNLLFKEDGSNSEILEKGINLCKAYNLYNNSTEKAIKAIEEAELFTEKQLSITTKDQQRIASGAFKVIDVDKFSKLSDAAFIKLRKNQALWVIHTHIISMDRVAEIAKASGIIQR